MGEYDSQIAIALKLIKKKGQLVTWVKQNVSRDGTKPWKTTEVGGGATFPVSIVFIASGSAPQDAFVHLIKGTSVPTGAPKGLMGAVPFVPEINDHILRGSDKFNVESIEIVQPNGDPILYKIQFA